MKKLLTRWTISMMSIVFLSVCGEPMKTSATGNATAITAEIEAESEILFVTGYEVTNETITPGNEFTLTIHIHNFGESITAPVAHVVITNPQGVIPEYGTISEAIVEEIGPGEDVSLSFKYNAEAAIDSSYLDFRATITTEMISSVSNIRIAVGRSTDFEAENVLIPRTYEVNQADYVGAKVTNLSMSGVSNVIMVARCDGEDIASTRIGSMVAGTNKTETFSVTFTEEGDHLLDLVLTYTDQYGESKEYVITSTTVEVTAEADSNTSTENISDMDEDNEISDAQDGINLESVIIICICGFLLIAACCVVLIMIYRRK